jgi:hypothetical protein
MMNQAIGQNSMPPTFTAYSGSAALTPPTPTAPIHGTTLALDQYVTNLHEMLTELERRLEPILTPTAPATATSTSGATTVQPGSAHQMALANLSFAVMSGVERVNRLLGRLEI